MNIFIPLGLLLSLLCYYYRKNPILARNAFYFSMIAAFIFAAIRYEFGPDYFNYHDIYNSIVGVNLDNYEGKGMTIEKPFLILLSLFPNYTSFIIFLALLWFIPFTIFITRFVPHSYYWVAILYLFISPDFFLSSLVAMRTTICAAIFLFALYFLLKNKKIVYVLLIIIASRFHTSSIVLVLFALFNTKNRSLVFSNVILIAMGFVSLINFITGENQIIQYLTSFVMENVEELQRYSEREIGGTSQTINTLIFRIISFVVFLFLVKSGKKEKNPQKVVLYKIAVCASLMSLIFGQSLISDRYLLILNPIFITCIILSFNKNPKLNNVLIMVFLIVVATYIFYNKSTRSYFVTFLNYHTIFTAPTIP